MTTPPPRIRGRATCARQLSGLSLDDLAPWTAQLRDERSRRILSRWQAGDPTRSVAAEWQLTTGRIYQIVHRTLRAIGAAQRGTIHPEAFKNHFTGRPEQTGAP